MYYKRLNNLTGWVLFTFAACIYLKTKQSTVSFWDCGEFLACADKLEIGHQPGAPLFLLLGRLFALLSGGHPGSTARMINSLSALASALTILFLFFTITRLTRRAVTSVSEPAGWQMMAILLAGLAGSLVYVFSDTFWFSAVEAEVYATSSLFTAVSFWAILKWADSPQEGEDFRWIFLIAYLMGLSVGVHLLNLLTIPALVWVYYYTANPAGRKRFLWILFLSAILLYSIVFIVIPGLVRVAAIFDLLFVNGIGFPVNSGAVFYLILLAGLLVLVIRYSQQRRKIWLYRGVLMFTFFCIGYSSYILLIVRAAAGPPVNLNNVRDPFSLLEYINREQYISRPLVFGPYYNAPVTGYKARFTYVSFHGKYIRQELNPTLTYDHRFMTFFPRMASRDPQDIQAYNRWVHVAGKHIHVLRADGTEQTLIKPTFLENLAFFFRYQVGYMYFRYFMWNFTGRQNEDQGTGNILHGNWITGIPFVDQMRLGPQKDYPERLFHNKGRNVYFGLPFLLGLIGLVYHFRKNRPDFLGVLVFFLMTGVAVVIYLNEIPLTPRERDYAVGGSFYVFSIWIGLGAVGLIRLLQEKAGKVPTYLFVFAACVICIPGLMAYENWDDHDRSHRYVARDFAYDYLNSCAPNAILFTNADNDTYPLWYAQEVEGIRTDVRVILAPFLGADWYIAQLKDWHQKAAPVPLTIDAAKYASGNLDQVPYYKRTVQSAELGDLINFISSNDPRALLTDTNLNKMNYYPTRSIRIPVDTVQPGIRNWISSDPESVPSPIEMTLPGNYLLKNEIVILDILATNNWKRPVYFLSAQVPRELGLTDYLEQDGFAYRLVPRKHRTDGYTDIGSIRSGDLYTKLMKRFRWGNMNDPRVFMNDNCVRTTSIVGIRNSFARLAEALILQGEKKKAIAVLDRCMQIMPQQAVPFDYFMLPIIGAYDQAGAAQKASMYARQFEDQVDQELNYYQSLKPAQLAGVDYDLRYAQFLKQELDHMTKQGAD